MGRGGQEDSENEEEVAPDERIDWLLSRIQSSLNCKEEQVQKLMATDTSRSLVLGFLDSREKTYLHVAFEGSNLTAFVNPPKNFKKKSVYFVKLNDVALTKENMQTEIVVGDLGDVPLEYLSTVSQEVFLPILTNPRNQKGWPEVLSKDITDHMNKFVANVYINVGHTKGKTLLPLPPSETKDDKGLMRDKDRVHILESAVITWTRQIKNVLKSDPEAALKDGANPGPLVEIEFWNSRANDLNSIIEQLSSERIKKVIKILELSKSTYSPAFNRLCKEIVIARLEANDNVKFLKALRPYLEKLSLMDDFAKLPDLFKPILHLILLIWKHSKYYNTATRLVILIREICNDLIMQACRFLAGDEILQMDPNEAAENLKTTLKVLGTFKSYYFDYKAKTQTESPANMWRFQNSILFARLDSFMERCHDILDLSQTVLQFNKLEKVEVGGTKGKTLTTSVRQIFADFQQAVSKFHSIEYDILSVESKEFDDDFYEFRCSIKELERRIGSVISQGLDDCTTISMTFKLLDSFEGLLEREIIAHDLEEKRMRLLQSYAEDIRTVYRIFNAEKESPCITNNKAPSSGAVSWVQGLKARIEQPMLKFKNFKETSVSQEYEELLKSYTQTHAVLCDYEKAQYNKWTSEVGTAIEEKLKCSLLVRVQHGLYSMVKTNFDPVLVRMLREVKYFLLLGFSVPESTMKIYERNDELRGYIANLDVICTIYNTIQKDLLPVEKPLFEKKLEDIDKALEKGLDTLNWNSHKIDNYISEVMNMVKELHKTLTVIKENIESTREILKSWEENTMFERKDGQVYSVEDFKEAHEAVRSARYAAIEEGGKGIKKNLANSNRILKVSKGAPAWKAYVEYASDIITSGISKAILASLNQLHKQIDAGAHTKGAEGPLLEISLELAAPNIVWRPDVGESGSGGGVRDMFNSWLKDFLNVGSLLKRLDTEGNYQVELEEDFMILDAMSQVQSIVIANEGKCIEFKDSYKKYEYLWANDLQASLADFLEGESEPSLDSFDEQVQKYKMIQEEIHALPTTATIGWIRINSKPIKQALSTWVTKWIYLFTNYLSNKVITTMNDLHVFIENSFKILDQTDLLVPHTSLDSEEPAPEVEGEEGEAAEKEEVDKQKLLYEVMGCIRDIRKRLEETDNAFEPLKQTVTLLQSYKITLPDSTIEKLDNIPHSWEILKKRMAQAKDSLQEVQLLEARDIRSRSDEFQVKVETFRKNFQKDAPFTVAAEESTVEEVENAYKTIDSFKNGGSVHGSLSDIIAEAKYLNECQDLFELFVSDYVQLRRCDEELGYLKELWDMIGYVVFTFNEWKLMLWEKIDTEFLTMGCKKIQKQIKGLNKALRGFQAFEKLEGMVKAMVTSLPLVDDLHQPFIRDRHVKQIMRATGKQFTLDENFTLGGLLLLELHNHLELVSEIVERAQKEVVVEKVLKKVEETWASFSLIFTPFPDSEVLSVSVDELVMEALENDNVILQNVGSGKHVQSNPKFLEMVTSWQTKLGNVDFVLASWKDVQRKWSALESIFIHSSDIRVQLPEDSKRFDGINADFIDLMSNAPNTTNVVEACNQEGFQERLDNMLDELELCEKALNEYLETKRMIFPRFYFVSQADLLDMLSKGNNPVSIEKHLPKNFDTVSKLEFQTNEKGEVTKTAVGMYSKEMEYVKFAADCVCDGPVENWLGTVVAAMQKALSYEFKTALPVYEEKPRQKWILENSTQMTVVITRVMFTQQMNEAFEQLEDGNTEVLKEEFDRQVSQISDIVELITGELTKNDRKKLITLCTLDVHARDVVLRFIDEKVEAGTCFQWQSQLRYFQHEETKEVKVDICDATIKYGYEYIGNCGCLCITPLTDRCYITLTQAQRLVLGGAPAGPAGTGKTETVKDLGRCLGVQVYVYNCSDQMDYKTMGSIYKGLAQTGAWGCFDEFNRIPVAVLSVCSTQYKSVLDAIRAQKPSFILEDVDVKLIPSAMAFITMNPGYPGRAELPESLKALFRPVSMCVPDLALICEVMLMAEGFQDSKLLARKFVILYSLSGDLLSKSAHYDWKLRAIKTTLYVAGGMKRDSPELSEDKVLLRALRDFNLGKLTTDDSRIFMGLLEDLFPNTLSKVPRAIDDVFEEAVKKAGAELAYQTDDVFRLKVSQLREIFQVRWSVFLLGPAGSGKTAIWKTLQRAQQLIGEKTQAKPINPKAVTRNELYGYVNRATREWNEGLISTTFRDMSNNDAFAHQWIVLDGDIDAEWIESMNTVMDDNKMLTLASNERIPLTATMRLLLEINHMIHCSPATVSRGGVIYVNETDVGVQPVIDSWIAAQSATNYKSILSTLFAKYLDKSLEFCRRNFRTIIPLSSVSMAQGICKILEGIIPKEENAPRPDQVLMEHHFVFACIWAIGGAMLVDKVNDFSLEFSKWWQSEFKTVQFPNKDLVFDYFVSETDAEGAAVPTMCHWRERVPQYLYAPENDFGKIFVPTVDTSRLTYLLDSLFENKHYVMFVGNTGTGKTAIMQSKLSSMDAEEVTQCTVSMNSFTEAWDLQPTLEAPLEKKSGMRFGPPGSRRLIYFIDDMNMPNKDKYDTQGAIEIVRQYVDYGGWYDKEKILLKEIMKCQLCASMNPTAGSFTLTPRMQRHFLTLAVQMPDADVLKAIYHGILDGHMAPFGTELQDYSERVVNATIELHKQVMNTFLPSAVKFHYQFNLRELSSVIQGMCRMTPEFFTSTSNVVRLWVHECERVFLDRLVTESDRSKFSEIRTLLTKKYFEDQDAAVIEALPRLFTSFVTFSADDEPVYTSITGMDALKKLLEQKLEEYNSGNPAMNLVLFDQAIEHITRITRIIGQPRGNAVLVGVGGSGKQSLARLASFVSDQETFQIQITGSYGISDFKEFFLSLYHRAGVKSLPTTFLITDNQIVDQRFLVYMNDFLATGYVADVFTQEERDNVCNAVRSEVKQAGIVDSTDNCWNFFISKVRKYLHIVMCFSPVGENFKIWARQFPALINCTVYDYFTDWPFDALVSVAQKFLQNIPDLEDEVQENVAYHMAFVHQAVAEACTEYKIVQRRHAYTTPKSYLELISLYESLLAEKRSDLIKSRERLENGVDKIVQASQQVADLQLSLKQEQIIVEEKKTTTDALIASIGQEKGVVDQAVESSRDDEEACAKIADEVTAFQAECEEDLKAAEPIIAEAEAALDSLDKASLGELKTFGSPSEEIVNVAAACMILTAPKGKIPKDLSWQAGKKMMNKVDAFLQSLKDFDKDNTPVNCVEKVEKDYMSNPAFTADNIRAKSSAAAGLCAWVINICKYYRIYEIVAPKRAKLADANKKLNDANRKLKGIRSKVKELQDRVASLEDNLMKATEDKNKAIAQADKTASKKALADRLINGLSGERVRWGESIEEFNAMEGKLIGDVLLASSFVSYAGPFDINFREKLVNVKWLPDMSERQIPMSEGIEPMAILTDESLKAQWNQEGLPTDPLSVGNGAIMSNAARWSLMIDPQLQGVKWVLNKEESNGLKVIQLSQDRYLDTVEQCMENGIPLLIENLGEEIDAVLNPVIGRETSMRGRSLLIKLGEKEIEYDPNFKLFLQTKLSNPHYRPEINAQTTLVNFCVTEKGLEDQILAVVVENLRPDLQHEASELVKTLAQYTITLNDLEDNLLFKLANAKGDILEDVELVENLEETKRTAMDIAQKVEDAKVTSENIATARETYRSIASRGSLMYFVINELNNLDRVYQFSMANYMYILVKGIHLGMPKKEPKEEEDDATEAQEEAQEAEKPKEGNSPEEIKQILDKMSVTIFQYITQGLFERHRLIAASELAFKILKSKGELDAQSLDHLLKGPRVKGKPNPLGEWLPESAWEALTALSELEAFVTLPDDIAGSSKRWKEWFELEYCETESYPGEWRKASEFNKLLMMRTLRPDRLPAAIQKFVENVLGPVFVESVPYNLERSFEDSKPGTPIFVFLSPGVDVAVSVEALGKNFGVSKDAGNYKSVSLGQGQEEKAINYLNHAHKNGGWVLLQNIHLTIDWTSGPLEKAVDKLAEGAHEDFRLFLSAEPPPSLERGLPISLLQNSIKLTNEPTMGLKENILRAYSNFEEEYLENCAKHGEFRSIIFALCYFHSALLERKKFGVGNLPGARSGIGWNMNYPFNTGDLLCCAQCAYNYLENANTVPWDDLRYIFGEIMYGGHVVEDWDRRLTMAYLRKYFVEQALEPMEMFPGFTSPPNTMNKAQVMDFVEETMPMDTPLSLGLHPNAEIGYKLRETETYGRSVLLLQPREAGGSGGVSVEEKTKMVLDEMLEKLPEVFDMEDIRSDGEDQSPYTMVAIQECERMNVLLGVLRSSLVELNLGLKGDLTMTGSMEQLMFSLANDQIPSSWMKYAYASLRPLGSWLQNLIERHTQLTDWTADMSLPKVVWLGALFNPQSFLTAVMQTTARRNDWPLDKTKIVTEVTKKQVDAVDAPPRDGAYISGLTLEGARIDEKTNALEDSRPKELYYNMPVLQVKAVTADKADMRDVYQCPVYTTEKRFREECFTAQLKYKKDHGELKWILAGVCLFLDVE